MQILGRLPKFSNKTGSKLKGNQGLIILWNLVLYYGNFNKPAQ